MCSLFRVYADFIAHQYSNMMHKIGACLPKTLGAKLYLMVFSSRIGGFVVRPLYLAIGS
jgi:hypothetical protein